MAKKFYSRLSYSIGNEDWRTELDALRIKPSDRVVAVTASGDRPLNLLFSDCNEIIAIDANPVQNALCELKKVALLELDYEHYIAFLGVTPTKNRLDTYNNLKSKLSLSSQQYWEKNQKKIQKGVLYEGAVENLLKLSSFFFQSIMGKHIKHLFECKHIDDQKAFIEAKWNEKIWRKAFELILNPTLARLFFKDPGLYAFVDPNIKMPKYLHDRLFNSLKKFPVKENILVSLACFGKVFEEGFSPYLTYEGTSKIKKKADKLQIETKDAISYLEEQDDNSIDCYSLSDVASYMSKEDFHRMCYALFRTAKPGARFCLRQFLSSYSFPEELTPYLQRDEELEKQLEEQDRCSVYRFLTGRIIKAT